MSDLPMAYIDSDGALTIRASVIGKCVRALWAALDGIQPMSPSDYLEDIFAEGHLHESSMREMLEKEGAIIDDQYEVTYWVLPGKIKIVGHLDGMIENWNQIWEAKSFSKDSFRRFVNVNFDAFPDYAWQVTVYMLATGLPALYTVKDRNSGEVMRFTLTETPITETNIKMKALRLYTAHKEGVMPDCDPERWGCPFFFLHDEAKEEEVQEVEDPYVDALAAKLLDTRLALKEMNEREKTLKEDLGKKLGTGKHNTSLVEVTIRKQTQRRLDSGLMIEAGLNPDDFKKEGEPFLVIETKERK